jgi:hypothetical protein
MHILKFHLICSNSVLFCFFIWFYFYSYISDSQQCAHRSDWKRHDFLLFFFFLINLSLYHVFQAPPSLWNFFQLSSTCPFHLKIGTCSLNIMLNNNFNFHTPWDSLNPYNPRLNQKQALWTGSKINKNNNFQHYNILSAFEVKDETSTSSTYVSLVFHNTIRSKKILVKK